MSLVMPTETGSRLRCSSSSLQPRASVATNAAPRRVVAGRVAPIMGVNTPWSRTVEFNEFTMLRGPAKARPEVMPRACQPPVSGPLAKPADPVRLVLARPERERPVRTRGLVRGRELQTVELPQDATLHARVTQ